MPLRNRVTPLGELLATPERGLVYGNRGCLHDGEGEIVRRYGTRRWIACRLEFRDRRRSPLMVPGRYTELFFLDEATALAAGHRPCAECRRADFNRLTEVFSGLHPGRLGADAIDIQLQDERLAGSTRARRFHDARYGELPDGAFVLHHDRPYVVRGDWLLEYSPGGYRARHRRPATGRAVLITPPSLVALLGSGWRPAVPLLHRTAARWAPAVQPSGSV